MWVRRVFFNLTMNMKNKFTLLLIASLTMLSASAQLNGNGYYRLKNKVTGEYASLASDVLSYDNALRDIGINGILEKQQIAWKVIGSDRYQEGQATVVAKMGCYLQNDIKMVSSPTTVPGSIFYIKNQSSKDKTYNLLGEGTSIYKITTGVYTGSSYGNFDIGGFYTYINSVSGSSDLYTMYINTKVTAKITVLITITKTVDMGNYYFKATDGVFGVEKDASAKEYAQWYIEPATTFNISCLEKVHQNGYYYTTLCVDFPFTIPESSTVNAAYKVVGKNADGYAVLEEIDGTIPGGTPVLLECTSYKAEDNVLNIVTGTEPAGKACADGAVITSDGNYLQGRYFNAPAASYSYLNTYKSPSVTESLGVEKNVLTNDQSKYRVLNIVNGQVGFYKLKNASSRMSANKAFLNIENLPTVSETNTKAFNLEAGDATTGIDNATTTSHDDTVYDLQGRRVTHVTKGGIYIVGGKKVAF